LQELRLTKDSAISINIMQQEFELFDSGSIAFLSLASRRYQIGHTSRRTSAAQRM
jgi:hypothetical protein